MAGALKGWLIIGSIAAVIATATLLLLVALPHQQIERTVDQKRAEMVEKSK